MKCVQCEVQDSCHQAYRKGCANNDAEVRNPNLCSLPSLIWTHNPLQEMLQSAGPEDGGLVLCARGGGPGSLVLFGGLLGCGRCAVMDQQLSCLSLTLSLDSSKCVLVRHRRRARS